jgi:hypothetical protein
MRPGHARDATEAFHRFGHARVVGGNDHGVNAARSRGAAEDVLDHRPAVDFCEWFSGESCRTVAGGNNRDCGHLCRPFEWITERNRVHGES